MEVTHLPLGARKNIALRLAYFDTFPRYGHTQPLLLAIQNEIELCGDLLEIGSLLDKSERLDLGLQRIASKIRHNLEPMTSDPVIDDSLAKFDIAIQNISCGRCCSLAQTRSPVFECQVCHGNDLLDSVVVAHEGACIEQLHSLFKLALEIAKEYYSWSEVSYDRLASVHFATNQCHLGDLRDDLPTAINARANVDIDQHRSLVELSLVPTAFNRKTYESLFYILLHECVCHAFQGTIDASGDRGVLGSSDSFAEGWMDYVTHLILGQLSSGNGPFGDRWYDSIGGDALAEAGSAIHRHRTDGTRAGLPTKYDRAKTAAKAARDALEFSLRGRAYDASETPLLGRARADSRLIQLSAQFNLLPWGDSVREHIITDVLLLNRLDRQTFSRYLDDYLDGAPNGAQLLAERLQERGTFILNQYSLDKRITNGDRIPSMQTRA